MQKPIGHWLKTLDRLIDENFDRALAAEGVQRRHWQILNILQASPAPDAEIAVALGPFWAEGAIAPGEFMDDLTRRGWITGHEPRQLTQDGQAALDAIRERTSLRGRSWPASPPSNTPRLSRSWSRWPPTSRPPDRAVHG